MLEHVTLKKEIELHLTDVIIPFWLKLKDPLYGGYYGFVSSDLEIDQKAEKGCILNSRILWFFSQAYQTFKDPVLLEAATHAYTFLQTACTDLQKGGLYWSLTYDGKPLDSTKHTYNQAFAIYGLTNYYKATGEPLALEMALALFDLIETKCKDNIGYLEAFDQDFNPMPNDKLSENGIMAHRTMNTLLHVFEAYTLLYEVTQNAHVKKCLLWILDIFSKKVYNPSKRRQEVFFNAQMESILDIHSYGHDIETAWLIDLGCKVLGDAYLKQMAPITDTLAKEIYDVAFDGASVLNEKEGDVVDTSRIWWVQAEAMVGFLNAYEKDPKKSFYLDATKSIWAYIKDYVVDKRPHSEWFGRLDSSAIPAKDPLVEPWKCPYHNGRMCFEMLRRLHYVA